MGDLTRNFSSSEFACRCDYSDCLKVGPLDTILVYLLQGMRDDYGKPIYIESGIRCARHNADIGGVPDSMHLRGKAADISIPGSGRTSRMEIRQRLYDSARRVGFNRIGMAEMFLHVDTGASDKTPKVTWLY